ncbi:Fur family transcriptional regulator [Paracoccaceae bacterium GXU_MW_L88]
MTATRRRVLEILLESHKAMGAYEILDRLKEEGLAKAPPIVYRALDFLTSCDFAHRIEALNAFVACIHPEGAHQPGFLICNSCHKVAETHEPALRNGAHTAARNAGFNPTRIVVEITGLCPDCASA